MYILFPLLPPLPSPSLPGVRVYCGYCGVGHCPLQVPGWQQLSSCTPAKYWSNEQDQTSSWLVPLLQTIQCLPHHFYSPQFLASLLPLKFFAPLLFRISCCQLELSLPLLPLSSNLSLAHNFCQHTEHTCKTPPKCSLFNNCISFKSHCSSPSSSPSPPLLLFSLSPSPLLLSCLFPLSSLSLLSSSPASSPSPPSPSSPPSPPSIPRHVVMGMLVARYMTSVVPLHCYQFLYLRISSNFPFYLLVLLVSGQLSC